MNLVQKAEIMAIRDLLCRLHDTPLSAIVSTNFADKRQSSSQYSSFAD
jgi:hypothetical protein